MKNHIDSPFEIKEVTDTGAFMGMGSVFGNIDQGGDIVASGAFSKSLASGRSVALLWQHRPDTPIGVYQSVTETAKGLEVSGKLALKTQQGAEAYELLKMGAITGLSIGGYTTDDDYNAKSGVRTIKGFDLREISLVTFPMNESARIAAVKSIDELDSLRRVEQFLRDSGLPKQAAIAIVSRMKALVRSDSDDAGVTAIQNLLKQRARILA